MTIGLPVSRLIDVSVDLTPQGAQFANVNSLLIVGDSDVIDVQQRIRFYASAAAIATDFGTTAPEYLAAVDFFNAAPQPTQVYIGKWAQAAVAGRLIGAPLTTAQQALANFTAITAGSLKLTIDGGAATTLSAVNLSGATNLNGVASILQTALANAVPGTTCIWTGTAFQIKSPTTGVSSSVSFPVTATGSDMKTLLGLTQAQGARSVGGVVAESALAAVQALDQLSTYWYGLTFASVNIQDSDRQAIAGYIEGDTLGPHLYGITTQAAGSLDPTSTTDIGYLLTQAKYTRTFGIYSSSDPYAVAEIFGRMVTIDWTGSDTVPNFMYQPMPGLTAETLTVNQANALDGKNLNYLATYSNGVAVLGRGETFGGTYIDEMAGADWLANYVQTNLFNLLADAGTKVPQTDDGMHLMANNIEASLTQGVKNGFLAPGTWNAGGFGQLATGGFLPKGYYVYAPPIADQAAADRSARKSVAFQIAAKQAGAVDTANITINVNR